MQPFIPNLTFDQLRQAKKYTSSALKALNIDLSSSTAGNLTASIFGYSDWNTAKALCEADKKEKLPHKDNSDPNRYEIVKKKILSNIIASATVGLTIAEEGVNWLINDVYIALEWHADINMWNEGEFASLDELKSYIMKGILIEIANTLESEMGVDLYNDVSMYVDQTNGEQHLFELVLSNRLYDAKLLTLFGVDESQFMMALSMNQTKNVQALQISPDLSHVLFSRNGQISPSSVFSNSQTNHLIAHQAQSTKESDRFLKTVGYFESIGHSEKDAFQMATFASDYGIYDDEPLEWMSKEETIACITHAWHCKVLKLLDEDKKTFDSEHFSEYLEIHDIGGPKEKPMKRYLEMLKKAKNDLETFEPFFRQLGIKKSDVETALARYEISKNPT